MVGKGHGSGGGVPREVSDRVTDASAQLLLPIRTHSLLISPERQTRHLQKKKTNKKHWLCSVS